MKAVEYPEIIQASSPINGLVEELGLQSPQVSTSTATNASIDLDVFGATSELNCSDSMMISDRDNVEVQIQSSELVSDRLSHMDGVAEKHSSGDPSFIPEHSTLWSPKSKAQIQQITHCITPKRYRKAVTIAREKAQARKITPPQGDFLDRLEQFGATWDEVVEMLNSPPLNQVIKRHQANELVKSFEDKQHSLEKSPGTDCTLGTFSQASNLCASKLRSKDLKAPQTSPIKNAAWSPGVGIITGFVKFIREKFSITDGRNVAMAIARDVRDGRLVYTLASTDGPPGGHHSELLAWDALLKPIKDMRRVLIYTERAPCTKGSNCNAKLKQVIGEECHVIYSRPITQVNRRQCSYSPKQLLGEICAKAWDELTKERDEKAASLVINEKLSTPFKSVSFEQSDASLGTETSPIPLSPIHSETSVTSLSSSTDMEGGGEAMLLPPECTIFSSNIPFLTPTVDF